MTIFLAGFLANTNLVREGQADMLKTYLDAEPYAIVDCVGMTRIDMNLLVYKGIDISRFVNINPDAIENTFQQQEVETIDQWLTSLGL